MRSRQLSQHGWADPHRIFRARWFSIVHFVIYVGMAVVAGLVGIEGAVPLIVGLVATAVIELFGEFVPSRFAEPFRFAPPAFLGIAATLLDSRTWVVAIIFSVTILMWLLDRSNTSRMVVFQSLSVFVTAVVGLAVSAPDAGFVAASLLVMLPITLWSALRMRSVIQRSADDMLHALEASGTWTFELDLDSRKYISLNGPLFEVTGFDRPVWEENQRSRIHPDDVEEFWVEFTPADDGKMFDRSARFRTASGQWVWLRDVSRFAIDANGNRRLVGLVADISHTQSELIEMRRLASVDSLTGVANRFALDDELAMRMRDNRGETSRFALLVLDLNRFKEINDSLGHGFGDQALRELAGRLVGAIRPGDVIARLGGDEFAVLAMNIGSYEQAAVVAQRIADACVAPLDLGGVQVTASVSVGAALNEPGLDPEELIRRADSAMYVAKRSERTHQVYTSPIGRAAGTGIGLGEQLPAALSNGEFELFFQPKYDFVAAKICGFEGLARWRHPELGLLTPSDFIHLFDVSESTRYFTDLMLDAGIAFAARCRGATGNDELTVSVNVSIITLYDDAFPLRMRAMLEKYQVPPAAIILEITEQDIMEEASGAPPVLTRLSDMGVGVSIDDFGTGYSSLARLQDLPVSEIKIDRRFVTNAPDNSSDKVIVRSIVDLASNLGLRVVAEGVENTAEADLLISLGCDQGQGYLYGRPATADDAIVDLRDKPALYVVPDDEVPGAAGDAG